MNLYTRPESFPPAPALICTAHIHLPPPATPLPPFPTTQPVLKICVEDVNRVFIKQKSRKDSGPDCISPVCLKGCAYQLAPQIYTDLQQISGAVRSSLLLQMLQHHSQVRNHWPFMTSIPSCLIFSQTN